MGQKVNPIGFRLGQGYPWKSRWFASPRVFSENLLADIKLRQALFARLKTAGITDVVIERLPKAITVRIFVTRPGMVIGRGGTGIEDLKRWIVQKLPKEDLRIDISVEELRDLELSAYFVATRIVSELERRLPARRVATRAIERVMAAGALGAKIVLSGRIGGAEIARRQRFQEGSVPAQTLRANIDYAQVPALLKRGYVGVKVWIHKKES